MSGASSQLSAFNYAVQPLGNLQIKNITAAYTVSPSDSNFILNSTSGVYTISMPPASSFSKGFNCVIWNTTIDSADVITIDPNGAETIDGKTTIILRQGEGTQIICDGTNWQTGNKKTMRGYAENIPSDQNRPIASATYSVAIGMSATASGSQAFAIGRAVSASGNTSLAIGCDSTSASSARSTAIGSNSSSQGAQAVTGSGAMALGGSYASGTDSFAAGVASNSSSYGATGANSIAIGNQAKSTATGSVAISANRFANAQATANGAVAIGDGALASGALSTAIGRSVTASSGNAVAIGTSALADITGKYAFSNSSFASSGDSQTGTFILRRATTDATATVLTTDNAAASTTNQVILPNNSAFAFSGTIIARQQAAGGSNYAAWEVKGAILRDGTAASTVLGSYNINVLSKTAGASAWDLTLSADTTNGGLAVTATGAASVNIRWVATIQTSEVTYA